MIHLHTVCYELSRFSVINDLIFGFIYTETCLIISKDIEYSLGIIQITFMILS